MLDEIKREYFRRRSVNYSYSLRAFASHAGLSAGAMSEIINNKRPLSKKTAEKVCRNLNLSDQVDTKPEKSPYQILHDDEFALIADWYYYGILSLMKIRGFESNPAWIAKRLGISQLEAREALSRLERLGIITKREGRYVRVKKRIATITDIPSEALRESHRQNIAMAEQSLFRDPVEIRDITAATMAISKAKIKDAKKMIQEFRERFVEKLETSNSDCVYNLCVQLYPLTKET